MIEAEYANESFQKLQRAKQLVKNHIQSEQETGRQYDDQARDRNIHSRDVIIPRVDNVG